MNAKKECISAREEDLVTCVNGNQVVAEGFVIRFQNGDAVIKDTYYGEYRVWNLQRDEHGLFTTDFQRVD